ncbi:FKBP-type peptidyl-prolyl cis-trans isomerase FkpA [Pseudoduganella flava]|uniref:Peptidyl-prolyl cis-trans isomerase n=1 Tax=Pseudoduganella flava TaxID=871742 RepID=A0A562PPG6_9BURK|nr:FKBP-type peptidyl-prolyl cis-trans isomerase [Pseudoduganella flava]QGZ40512.1 FKBP-type peptidyl-prolyl cis-trans isomerase [Pseudoduganella flava]TWI45956.1 FKBP-type peptidyl-prolyl cis-trans isomerase FkpA [Pseudoduganella flava]
MKSMFQILATLACALALTACGGGGDDDTTPTTVTEPQFTKVDLTVGTGIEAIGGDVVTVAYTGWLYDSTKTDAKGTQFDQATATSPFTFQLGKGVVIQGWDQGVLGMKVGGKRRLIVPSTLAYGKAEQTTASGVKIAANSTLVFEVEVLAIKR